MKHYIITRMTLDLCEDFMGSFMKRKEIIDRYTLPSILNQTCKDFEWVGIFHWDTPWEIIEEYSKYMKVIISDRKSRKHEIEKLLDGDTITTRFDNDDVLAPDFIEKVQEIFKSDASIELVSPISGAEMDYHTKKIYQYKRMCASPFISLKSDVYTVYQMQHGQMDKIYTTYYLDTLEPLRCRILHWGNIARKVPLSKIETSLSFCQ